MYIDSICEIEKESLKNQKVKKLEMMVLIWKEPGKKIWS